MVPLIQSLDDFWHLRRKRQVWLDALRYALSHARIDEPIDQFNLLPHTSFPVFASARHIVKIVGFLPAAELVFEAERAALTALDGLDFVPGLIAAGSFANEGGQFWGYVVCNRMEGTPLDPKMDRNQVPENLPVALAAYISQIRQVPANGVPQLQIQFAAHLVQAAASSKVGALQISQVQELMNEHGGQQARALCNADIWQPHLLMAQGELKAIVDWGDAVLADPHFEHVQVYLNLFGLNKAAMRRYLSALGEDWCPQRMMLLSLIRQATMFNQHGAGDVFYRVPSETIAACDGDLFKLADAIFAL